MQPVVPSATGVTVHIKIIDATDGSPETGVTSATSGLALSYRKGALGILTAITESDLAAVTSPHADGGMKHVDGGVYRVDVPDAAVPTAEFEVTWITGTVTGMQVIPAAIVGRYAIGAAGAGLTAVGLATGAITAATVATGAIDADALAADAVTEIADGVWDEALSGHATAGTAGAALSAAGSASDPLTNTVPGSYASGTAGYALGRIGTGVLSITALSHLQAGNITIVQGDSYHSSDGNAITFQFTETRAGLSWNGDTVTIHVEDAAGTTASWSATCSQSGTTVTVTVGNLTSANTDDFVPGVGTWQMRGEPGASGRPITVVEGLFTVKASLAV